MAKGGNGSAATKRGLRDNEHGGLAGRDWLSGRVVFGCRFGECNLT